jgi:hypothetical protein
MDRYSEEDLLGVLRLAATIVGEPLQVHRYQQIAAKRGLPAHMTFITRFGSWTEACRQAGVASGETLVTRSTRYSKDDCIRAIRKSKATTYDEYAAWAKGRKGYPSGPTVRARWGRWSIAFKEAQSVA